VREKDPEKDAKGHICGRHASLIGEGLNYAGGYDFNLPKILSFMGSSILWVQMRTVDSMEIFIMREIHHVSPCPIVSTSGCERA